MKPVEEMTLDEIEAERAKIKAERERMYAEPGYVTPGSDTYEPAPAMPSGLSRVPDPLAEPDSDADSSDDRDYSYPAEKIEGAFVEAAARAAIEDAEDERLAAIEQEAAARRKADKPAPWPHEHMAYLGLELDIRTPNQSALMAISMLQQLDGLGELQMEIFNTFLANHLSPRSLADVIMEMTRPDSEITMQGLVQALVRTRANAE